MSQEPVEYEVRISAKAAKQLDKLPAKAREKMRGKLATLSANPRPEGAIKLEGSEKQRVRSGNYRAIYYIEDSILVVLVVRVADRKEAYDE